MGEERKSGWLSSVVGNISSLWSRPTLEEDEPPHLSFTEEQSERDFETVEKFENNVTKYSPDKPTTSSSVINEKSRSTRYLSPTLLMSSVKPQSDSPKLPKVSNIRKRPFMEELVESSEVKDNNVSRNRFSTSNIFSDELFTGFSSRKRICRPSRVLSDTVSNLDKSLLDRSVDPLNTSRNSVNGSRLGSRVSRASSFTSSALSSKTLAILQQLEKISTPAMEAKKLPFKCRSERWFADERNSSIARILNNSTARTPSRAQVISNRMSSTLPQNSFWHRPNKLMDQISKNVNDNSLQKNNIISSTVLTKSLPDELERDSGLHNNEQSVANRKKHEPVLKSSDGKSVKRLTNLFSAKDLDLEVDSTELEEVRPLYESWSSSKEMNAKVMTPAPGFLGIASKDSLLGKVDTASSSKKIEDMSCLGDDLFSFSRPEKRGPSTHKQETSDDDASNNSESDVDDKSEESDDNKTKATANEKNAESEKKTTQNDSDFKDESTVQTKVDKVEKSQPNFPASGNGDVSKETNENSAKSKSAEEVKNTSEVKTSEKSEKWTCKMCWVANEKTASKCVCCGTIAPAVENFVQPKVTIENTTKTTVEKSKSWSCPDCFVSNKVEDEKCVCCGHVKKNLEKNEQPSNLETAASQKSLLSSNPQQPITNVFGDKAFKPLPSTGMTFGLKKPQEVTQNTIQPPTTTSSAAVPFGVASSSVPKFGLNSSSSAPNFGILCSAPQPSSLTTVSEVKAPTTSIFGAPPAPKSFASEPKTSQESHDNQTMKNPFAINAPNSNATSMAPVQQPLQTATLPFNTTTPFGNTSGSSVGMQASKSLFQNPSGFGNKSFNVPSTLPQTSTTFSFGSSSAFGNSLQSKTVATSATSPAKDGSDSVTMASPTSSGSNISQPAANGGFNFSTAAPTFNFLANSSTTSGASSNVFGSLTSNAPSAGPTFTFGSSLTEPSKSLNQNTTNLNPTPSLTKVFSAPSTVPPASFNFGANTSNPGSIFSAPPPTSFNFGASAENPFNASGATPFGNAAAAPTNFFTSGTTSSNTTTRRVLKARRMRK